MNTGAGKGDEPRPVNRKKWDTCPLWNNIGLTAKNKKKEKIMKNKSGFTMIEVLVVIAILVCIVSLVFTVRGCNSVLEKIDWDKVLPKKTEAVETNTVSSVSSNVVEATK